MDIKGSKLLTSNCENFTTEELKEQFVKSYSSKMGWDSENLTTEQLSVIKSTKEYKNPNMLCS
jgi:hypothetical protein